MAHTRVMKMIGGTCYSVHVDNDPRIHIPLDSDDKNYFIVNDELFKMPQMKEMILLICLKTHILL